LEVVPEEVTDTTFDDLERSLTQIWRAR